MRAVAVTVWIFINLVFVGMCGYIYLLWSQYWQYVERQHNQMAGMINSNSRSFSSSGQIFYYYHGSSESVAVNINITNKGVRNIVPKHHLNEKSNKTSVTVVRRRSQPRFPKLRNFDADVDSKPGKCRNFVTCEPLSEISVAHDKLTSRVAAYKNQLVVQLRRVLLEESSVFKARGDGNNPYNVQYKGPRGSYLGKSVKELLCELKHTASMKTLSKDSEPFRTLNLAKHFPSLDLFQKQHYNTCAIVTNAGSLYGSGLGNFIDSHDIILRFNDAPTQGYEGDVGSRTTIRILNSQVVSKPQFNFLGSPMYRGILLLVWDPSNYSASLKEWYENPDFDLFTPYFKHRSLHPSTGFYMLDPRSQWSLWDYIQSHIPVRIRRNPPSSGFLGLALMLPHCTTIRLMEYVPSVRLTKRCHYWDVAEDSSCTFGVWHPLAAEKLLTLALNVASDRTVFSEGYVTIPGFHALDC